MILVHEFVNDICGVTNRFQQNLFACEMNKLPALPTIPPWIKRPPSDVF